MLLGIIIGIWYCYYFFGKKGELPNLQVTFTQFDPWISVDHGIISIYGKHIHHWMIFSLLLLIFYHLEYWNLFAFSIIMVLHGLTYSDRFELFY